MVAAIAELLLIREAAFAQSPKSIASSPPTALLVAGKSLYVEKCQTCHGGQGQGGDARLEKVLGAMPKALRSPEVQQKSDKELAAAVRTGSGKMKPIAGLTSGEIRQIVAYVRTLRTP